MSKASLIPATRIEQRILFLRDEKVMLDFDLAELYGVPTKVFNQAVKRNLDRFPEDFMFRLSPEETKQIMRSQIVTSSGSMKSTVSPDSNWSQIVTSSRKHRGLAYRPYAFTEQGVAMLSSVLTSPRAVQVNIAIMRAFVQLREMLASHSQLARKLDAMEKKYDASFRMVFEAIRKLMVEKRKPRREIGFHTLMVKPGKIDGSNVKKIQP